MRKMWAKEFVEEDEVVRDCISVVCLFVCDMDKLDASCEEEKGKALNAKHKDKALFKGLLQKNQARVEYVQDTDRTTPFVFAL